MAFQGEEGANSGRKDHVHGVEELLSSLPRGDSSLPCRLYGGFWMPEIFLPGCIAAQRHLVARDDDILIASFPKSGTTWLKSLVFAVVWRGTHSPADPMHPLRRANPHDCVELLGGFYTQNRQADLEALPSPRILSVHTPYSILPASVVESGCRVIYICRNPKDVIVSYCHFVKMVRIHNKEVQPLSVERAVELFCSGLYPYGPYWEHVLEFWNESLRRPDKVFFVRYEDMKDDPAGNLRKMAAFLGRPFSEEEERNGTVGQILELCSFKSLKEMEVNQGGNLTTAKTIDVPRNSFFRRGEVGDWVNHFTPDMSEKLDAIIQAKLQGSGLKL